MSNIPITPGTGVSSVATETISGVDYQKIKVIDGTASGTTPLKINVDGSITASIYGNITGAVAASISGTVATTLTGTPSISGTVNIGTQSGSVVAFQGGTAITSISGSVTITGSVLTLYAPTASLVSGVTSVITGTAAASLLATAPGAQRNYVTNILVTNAAAVGTFVDIVDGANVLYSGYAAASGGGFSTTPLLKQPTLAAALEVKTRSQASVIVAATGYTAA